MIYYNEDKTQKFEKPVDLSKGTIKDDVIHHPEQPEKEGKFHYETIQKYANGGEDVKKIWDEEPQPYMPAYDEPVKVFIPYSDEEIKKNNLDDEMFNIQIWFDTYYAQHEQKYRRLVAMGKLTDDKKDPNQQLLTLYAEAEEKRKRIQEIEALLK